MERSLIGKKSGPPWRGDTGGRNEGDKETTNSNEEYVKPTGPAQVPLSQRRLWYNRHVRDLLQRMSGVLGAAAGLVAGGVTLYAVLKANGVIEVERGQGASLLMNTFTLPTTKTDFIRAIMSAATRANSNLSAKTRLMLAAWAAHESGWGKTKQAQKAYNLWNITAGTAWLNAGKPVMDGTDTEYTPGSKDAKRITQKWRAYGSLEESVQDILSFLSNSSFSNYRQAYQQLIAGDPTFVSTLGLFDRDSAGVVRLNQPPGTGSFYTLPKSEYQASMNKLIAEADRVVLAAGIAGLMAGTQS